MCRCGAVRWCVAVCSHKREQTVCVELNAHPPSVLRVLVHACVLIFPHSLPHSLSHSLSHTHSLSRARARFRSHACSLLLSCSKHTHSLPLWYLPLPHAHIHPRTLYIQVLETEMVEDETTQRIQTILRAAQAGAAAQLEQSCSGISAEGVAKLQRKLWRACTH